MRAIILAAGKGKRLDTISGAYPKCLLEVGGVSLIERQVALLRAAGLDEITVVVGFGAEYVREHCGPEISYVENELHAETNSLYSLWLTRELLADGFVVLNADVLFHEQMLIDLLSSEHEDALLISYQPRGTLGEEEMKVQLKNGRVVDISKQMDPAEADGENVGIVKFGPAGAALLVEKMNELVAAGNRKAWAPRAFHEFAAARPLHAISTNDYPWIEIDFPEDYARGVEEIVPELGMTGLSGEFNQTRAAAPVLP